MVARMTIMEPNFDSVLHPATAGSPARLIIRLQVALLPRDPSKPGDPMGTKHPIHLAKHMGEVRNGRVADGERFPFDCRSWLEREFNAYSIKFKQMVELSWNDQLILLPPDGSGTDDGTMSDADFAEFISQPSIPAHIRCSLDIQLIPVDFMARGRKKTHASIEVVKLKRPAWKQNPAGGFRSFAALMNDEDLDFQANGSLHQVVAAHEVGHWLGRPVPLFSDGQINFDRMFMHIDYEKCAALPDYTPGGDCEYGRTRGNKMGLMGAGQLVTEYEARPWLNRARRHTNLAKTGRELDDAFVAYRFHDATDLSGWRIVHRVHFNRGQVSVSDRQKRLVGTQ